MYGKVANAVKLVTVASVKGACCRLCRLASLTHNNNSHQDLIALNSAFGKKMQHAIMLNNGSDLDSE